MGHDPYPVKPGGNTPIPQATDTPEQPLKDVIIGIDPGHQLKADSGQEQISPNDEKTTKDRMTRGCTGVRSGVNEYDVNLAVSVKLMALLQDAGATVVMTRTKNDVSVPKVPTREQQPTFAYNNRAGSRRIPPYYINTLFRINLLYPISRQR